MTTENTESTEYMICEKLLNDKHCQHLRSESLSAKTTENNEYMIYEKELSDTIIGCAIEVHKTLGSAYMEKLYERALMIELAYADLHARSQVPLQVNYKNHVIGDYLLDIIVEEKVILELKACSKIIPVHEAQLIQYLYTIGLKIGDIINFGSNHKLEFTRKVL